MSSDYSCLFIVDLIYKCHHLLTDVREARNVLSNLSLQFLLVGGEFSYVVSTCTDPYNI